MMAMAQLLNIRMPGSHELTFLPPNPDVPGIDGKGAGQSGRGFIFIFICVQIKISQQDFRSTGFSLSCVNETDGSFPLSAAPLCHPLSPPPPPPQGEVASVHNVKQQLPLFLLFFLGLLRFSRTDYNRHFFIVVTISTSPKPPASSLRKKPVLQQFHVTLVSNSPVDADAPFFRRGSGDGGRRVPQPGRVAETV